LVTAQILPAIDPIGPISGVPEPPTWTAMLVGFGLLGAALRAIPGRRIRAAGRSTRRWRTLAKA
jgi:hypothetical protein